MFFCVSNDIHIPEGGLKSKGMISAVFPKCSNVTNSRGVMGIKQVNCYWGATSYKSMSLHLHDGDVGLLVRMKKIS